jgi:hypothetical protein
VLFLDANVIVSGLAGHPDGASAVVVATIRLGGLAGCTVENAMDEARRHLLALFNRDRLKISPAETDRELAALRAAPTFTVHPWLTARRRSGEQTRRTPICSQLLRSTSQPGC